MAEDYQRIENLELSAELLSRTRLIVEADSDVVETIRKGVIFLMAYWSGPARLVAFADLKRALETADPDGELELVILDVDGCKDLPCLPQFKGSWQTGAGETAWVHGGRVVEVLRHGTLRDFEQCCRGLLQPDTSF